MAVCHFGFMKKIYEIMTESVCRNGDLHLQRRKQRHLYISSYRSAIEGVLSKERSQRSTISEKPTEKRPSLRVRNI